MYKIAVLFVSIVLIASCGTQRQLKKSFTGKPVSSLQKTFGEPTTIIKTANDSVYVFEKDEELHSTEISQGKLTLDPIVTPKVSKTERYFFNVRNGIITKTRFEEEYERKN
ncbi:hypothetical protein SAMN05444274_11021 [Mariniphaga anaerophila]|uniref:Lipoprotein n=1 Tax=Mariniphaga anaerophila TaxID=1484053 RepID=A0A1M5ETJ0_9BACT|nr:hypothetical protein [Mariniphaga anaerophila]SHF82583.1 hypothetical protein SAMN05444274_11021 [Mariniphaga anaerophila]